MLTIRSIAGAVAAGVTVLAVTAATQSAGPAGVERIESPAELNTEAPQLTTEDGRVILSWVESVVGRGLVKFSERTPSGWSAAQTVIGTPDLMVNWADVPAVRALPGGTLVATWNQENGPNPEAYDLLLARSSDGGRTWTPPVKPHEDATITQHGFATVFPVPDGGFGLAWLDGRTTDPDTGEGDMALYATFFAKDGARRGPAAPVDPRVCECCQLATALTADGPIIAFRDRSPSEVRDIYVSRFASGQWSRPTIVHADNWTIQACPVNGPSIAARGRDVVVGWFTAAGDEGRSYVSFSSDAGRSFGAPIRVDETSSLGRMQVALLPDGAAAVSWAEFADGRSSFAVRRVSSDGRRGQVVTLAQRLGTQYPRIAPDGDGIVAAWVANTRGTTRVTTAHVTMKGE